MPKQVKKNKKVAVKKTPVVSKTSKKEPKKTTKKQVAVEVSPVLPPPVVPVKPESQKIWEEIMNLPIQMFGLPNQFIFQHCTPVTVEPTRLYVTIRSTAALPSLEAAIAPAFQVELADKFVIIKRSPAPLMTQKR